MPSLKILSTKLIGIVTLGKRTVKIGYVDRTDAWYRLRFSAKAQSIFKAAVEKDLNVLDERTEMIALQ